MADAWIVGAVRTAGGRKNGRLSQVHPVDLGAKVLDALSARLQLAPEHVDDVVFGCVSTVGAQSFNVARHAVLASSWPESVPGTVVDRQCGSGQQAIHFAAQAVLSGTQDLVVGGGVESMSKVPIGANVKDGYDAGHGMPFDAAGLVLRYPGVQFSQFHGAELLAKQHELTRAELDAFGHQSHMKAAAATRDGRFASEIVPVEVELDGQTVVHQSDEGIRADASLEKMQSLEPLAPGGLITAATASQICDGAAAVMVASDAALKAHKLEPLARIHTLSVVGDDPVVMLGGPIPATRKALARAGLSIDDIDLYEINEAFCSVPLAWAKALGADPAKLNVNGGATALGHPLGATGAKLMTTLVHELRRRGGRYGLLAICEGGGTANCTIIERV